MHTSGRNRPVASAKPATSPEGSAVGRSATVNAVPDVPIEITASPRSRPRPSAAAMLSPVPTADRHAVPVPRRVEWAQHGWQRVGPVTVGIDDREQIPPVRARRRRPVAGPRRVATIGRVGAGQPVGEVVVRQEHVGDLGPCIRMGPVEPRQLGRGERCDRHAADGLGPCGGGTPPNWPSSQAASGADSVSFHNLAGCTAWSAESSATMPCCWPPMLTAATSPDPVRSRSCEPAAAQAISNAVHHDCGSCSLHGGVTVACGEERGATMSPVVRSRISTLVDWVDESTPATKGTALGH